MRADPDVCLFTAFRASEKNIHLWNKDPRIRVNKTECTDLIPVVLQAPLFILSHSHIWSLSVTHDVRHVSRGHKCHECCRVFGHTCVTATCCVLNVSAHNLHTLTPVRADFFCHLFVFIDLIVFIVWPLLLVLFYAS